MTQLETRVQRGTAVTTLGLEHGNRIDKQCMEAIAAALDSNKAGWLVLTVSCEAQGPQQCAITCTSMGGSQVALLEMEEQQQTVATFRSTLAAQLQFHGHLRLVRYDGVLLNDEDATVADCLL
eukprot:gnl/TRDRNA2_/TRDRNA2_175336_c9_seq17.p1 gnl/TRDRNA2_/TRDRNA2_175336_c9~~gnl/TRDRNA2_/TRDRNA2_175336_c9_seq17.p1  ORF type:complete len:123 (-),score=17.20 gnl/TRDRNA2_/TRDRNA2_175336_c9_seq17:128-496(-)